MITLGAAGGVTGSTIFRAQDAPIYTIGMWYVLALSRGAAHDLGTVANPDDCFTGQQLLLC
jgi:hypothetical protein